MISDIRNACEFPLMARLERAREYAAEAKERNKPKCDCETCREKEMLPVVMQIVNNWPMQKKVARIK